MDSAALLEARRKAEQAVADMADGPLKVKAFEVILERLIPNEPITAPGSPVERQATVKAPMGAAGPTRASVAKRAPRSSTERVLSIRDEGFFQTGRTLSQIRDELASKGWPYPLTSLSGPVQTLVQRRELRRMMVKDGKKETYHYVNP